MSSFPVMPFELSNKPPGVGLVGSFEALVGTAFGDGVNALCWPRPLVGDFGEVLAAIGPGDEITSLDAAALRGLALGPAGARARDLMLADLRRLRDAGLEPTLDYIPAYPRDDDAGALSTDVYSWHADSAPVAVDTYLCSYVEAASEGVSNAEVVNCVDVPDLRAELLKRYGGADDPGFRIYLHEHFHDLHYVERPGARPWSLGLGHLWRIATEWPGSPVPPCIHRAPATAPGQGPRLLLIS